MNGQFSLTPNIWPDFGVVIFLLPWATTWWRRLHIPGALRFYLTEGQPDSVVLILGEQVGPLLVGDGSSRGELLGFLGRQRKPINYPT